MTKQTAIFGSQAENKPRDFGTYDQISQLKLYCSELKVDTLREVCEVCSAVLTEELEFVPSVQTPEELGFFLVCENETTKIDEDIGSFVDYQGYGESQLYGKQYASTDKGMVIYEVNCPSGQERVPWGMMEILA